MFLSKNLKKVVLILLIISLIFFLGRASTYFEFLFLSPSFEIVTDINVKEPVLIIKEFKNGKVSGKLNFSNLRIFLPDNRIIISQSGEFEIE